MKRSLLLLSILLSVLLTFAGITYNETLQKKSPPLEYELYTPNQEYIKELDGLIVCVDPGHGGERISKRYKTKVYTGGTQTPDKTVTEGDMNLRTAVYLKHLLEMKGAKVIMTRLDDRRLVNNSDKKGYRELRKRVWDAEKKRAHLFISIHHNWSGNKNSSGVLTIYHGKKANETGKNLSKVLSEIMLDEMGKMVPPKHKQTVWKKEYALTGEAKIPLTILEFGYFSNAEFVAWAKTPEANEVEAQAALNGIIRFYNENKEAIGNYHKELFGTKFEPKKKKFDYDELLRLSPTGKDPLTKEEIERTIQNYKKSCLSDSALFYFDIHTIEVTPNGKEPVKVLIEGKTNHPFLSRRFKEIFTYIPNATINMTVLPEDGTPEYGVTQAVTALTWREPAEQTGEQTQLLMGDPVWILDEQDGYLLVQASDGYWGWVREDGIARLTEEDFSYLLGAEKGNIQKEFHDGYLRLDPGSSFPILRKDANRTMLMLPRVKNDGHRDLVYVPNSYLAPFEDEFKGYKMAKMAVTAMRTPYVFGGLSRIGSDCSGLVISTLRSMGVNLSRDTRALFLNGKMTGTYYNQDNLQPGDLVFFVGDRGRIHHTGISLGGKRFIHQCPPAVQVNSFDPKDPSYSEFWHKKFFCSKRIFD